MESSIPWYDQYEDFTLSDGKTISGKEIDDIAKIIKQTVYDKIMIDKKEYEIITRDSHITLLEDILKIYDIKTNIPRSPTSFFFIAQSRIGGKEKRVLKYKPEKGPAKYVPLKVIRPSQPKKNQVRIAFRSAIRHQITAERKKFFEIEENPVCDESGIRLTKDNCHMDHNNPTFEEMVVAFLNDRNLTDDDIELEQKGLTHCIKDQELHDEWAIYHYDNKNLFPVADTINCDPLNKTGKTRERKILV